MTAKKNPIDNEGRDLLIELRTILVGKEGTSEMGVAGSIDRIEKHLNIINGTIAKQETKIERNRDRISTQWKIGGGLLALFGTGLIALLIKVLEML